MLNNYINGAAHERALLARLQHNALEISGCIAAELKLFHNASSDVSQSFAHQTSAERLVRTIESTQMHRTAQIYVYT